MRRAHPFKVGDHLAARPGRYFLPAASGTVEAADFHDGVPRVLIGFRLPSGRPTRRLCWARDYQLYAERWGRPLRMS
jgi:hypothetical protein